MRTEKFEQHSEKEINETTELLQSLRSNLPLFDTIYDNTIDFINNNPNILDMSSDRTRASIASNISKFTNAQQKAMLSGLLGDSEYENGQDKIMELIENSAKLIELLIKLLLSLLTFENHLEGYSSSRSHYSAAATDLIRLQEAINAGNLSNSRKTGTEESVQKFGFALKTKINYETKNDGTSISDTTQIPTKQTSSDYPPPFK